MVVVTDGKSNVQQTNTIPSANNARGHGIEVFAVGVGPEVNTVEITGIASTPTLAHTVYVVNSAQVPSAASSLLDLLCKLGNPLIINSGR